MTEDNPKERPPGGHWVEQQKKGVKKQAETEKKNQQQAQDRSRQQQDQGKVTEHSVSGAAGKEVRAGWFGNLKPDDCSAGARPQARMVVPAQYGIVKLRNAKVQTTARNCSNAELPSVVVFYESKPGFAGTDSFMLEVTNGGAAPNLHKFHVTVAGTATPAPGEKPDGRLRRRPGR